MQNQPSKRNRISSLAIVEDDSRVREYLAQHIRERVDVDELYEFSNAEDALQALSVNPPEMALFDIQLPGMTGIECIRKLKLLHPRIQVMILTVFDNSDTVFEALKAGASSYILKNTSPEKLAESIYELHEGGSPISSQIARKVIEAFQVKSTSNEHFRSLSRREQE
ncbi:MAG: response regulator transcription factor, partial [Sphingobacteriales bacterium]